jgi:class 3 adenylate cyclase
MSTPAAEPPRRERLILAVVDVAEFARASALHPDERIFDQLRRHYELVGREVGAAGGRVVKFMGDAALLAFPADDPAAVSERLERLRNESDRLWRSFGEGCTLLMKAGVGEVVSGPLGAPGDERPDVVGGALNALFKARWGDYPVGPKLRELTPR